MRNKPFIFLILFLILSSCGYQPIYSTKNLNFTIGKVEKDNTYLNNKFAKSINTLTNKESDKKINIKIESDKKIRVKGRKNATSPIDCNKKSAIMLPLMPKRFSIV